MPSFSIDPHRLEELLNYCTGFAKQMIEGSGEFYPFGAVIAINGQLTAVGGYAGEEHPKPAEVFELLKNSMRARFLKKEIVAAAIAVNVNIPARFQPPFPDGIRVLVECVGYARFIYLPYRISDSRADYAEFISVDTHPSICPGEQAS